MIQKIYIFILGYFLLGALAFLLINRKKPAPEGRQNWLKYATYFVLIHILFFSIVLNTAWFRLLGLLILIIGCLELITAFRQSGCTGRNFFIYALILFGVFSAGFLRFGLLQMETILFTFIVLSVFDAFSQLSGQLAGRNKLFPRISPAKTIEGLAGGVVFALVSALLLRGLPEFSPACALGLGLGIIAFSFVGDVLASYYKRKHGIKDFSRLLPGHGGFLDRFDSLIAGGGFMGWLGFFFF
jgi:phosphatidate cytidylyltransferase